MEFLEQVFWDNTVKDYLIFGGIVLGVVVLSGVLARLVQFVFTRWFGQWFVQEEEDVFGQLLLTPLRWLFVYISIMIAGQTLNFPQALHFDLFGTPSSVLFSGFMEFVLVIFVTWSLIRFADFLTRVLYRKAQDTDTKSDDQIVLFLRDILKFIIIILSIIFIMGNVFHLNVTSIIAGAGLAGLAVAMAAKETLENLLGSLVIFWEKPFTVGDFVEVEGVMGTIEKVGFRSTRIRTIEKTYVTVPNRKMVDSNLDNMTLRTYRRVRTLVGVTYGTSIEQIENIVKDIQQYLEDHPETNQDGIVGFHEFGDSALQILIQYYIQDLEWNTYIKIKEQINFEIMRIVQKNGSDFAFPTRTVHIEKT